MTVSPNPIEAALDELKWPENGLLPAIAIDVHHGGILMQAWQNREALRRTLETGAVHYWSRSRNELWHKGSTSGHVQRLVELRTDCDRDALLLVVEQQGPACHTGKPSCFFERFDPAAGWQSDLDNPWPRGAILGPLAATIEARVQAEGARSYVRSLLDDPERAAAKVAEEAAELIEAAAGRDAGGVAAEAADLLFHALVLARTRGVDWYQIAEVLRARFGTSGHVEKARRDADQSPGAADPTDS